MKSEWTLVIQPHQKLWSVDFREIWRYRDLISLFVKRNIDWFVVKVEEV